MTKSTCSFDGCNKPYRCKGYCHAHYMQFLRGNDLKPLQGRYKSFTEPYEKYVQKSPRCWGWGGTLDFKGYAIIVAAGKRVRAHRWSYEQNVGPIPAGMVIDHICHTRECTNPAHLRLATNQDNCAYRKGPNSTNTSGVRGVSKSGKKWAAQVGHAGKVLNLGRYDTVEEAAEVVRAKRAELHRFPEPRAA